MTIRTELTDTLIALIPEDGSRISNAEIKEALEKEAGESISDPELKGLKTRVIAMEAAEAAMGPGGGLKAPGVDPPPRTGASPRKKMSESVIILSPLAHARADGQHLGSTVELFLGLDCSRGVAWCTCPGAYRTRS